MSKEKIESRRAFMKKLGKLAGTATVAVPFMAIATNATNSRAHDDRKLDVCCSESSCSRACENDCIGRCQGTCDGKCDITCLGGCGGCTGCQGSCKDSLKLTN